MIKTLLSVLTLMVALATSTDARRGIDYGLSFFSKEVLFYVAPTRVPGGVGQMLSLCHRVDRITFFQTPDTRYVLAPDRCETDAYYSFSDAWFVSAQRDGLLPDTLPVKPILTAEGQLASDRTNAIMLALSFVIFLGTLAKIRDKRRVQSAKQKRGLHEDLPEAMVDVMCYAASLDGEVHHREITEIARIYQSLTGEEIALEMVIEQFSMSQDQINMAALADTFSDDEKEVLLQAAMHIACAKGEIAPSEYSFLCQLSEGLDLTGARFRTILQQMLASPLTRQAA